MEESMKSWIKGKKYEYFLVIAAPDNDLTSVLDVMPNYVTYMMYMIKL